MKTGDKLKLIRKSLGLTQKDVADLMGITPANISQFETGNRVNMTWGTLNKFLEVFQKKAAEQGKEITIFDLVGDEDISTDINEIMTPVDIEVLESLGYSVQELEKNMKSTAKMLFGGEEINKNDENLSVKMLELFSMLNDLGKQTAIERVEEMLSLPKYKKIKAGSPEETSGGEDLSEEQQKST